jgi:cytochrome c-type biogenesis protein CcmE
VTTAPPRPTAQLPPPSPRPKKNRTRYIVAAGGCLLAVVAVVVLTFVLSENVVYYKTVSEAVHSRTSLGTSRFRIAGAVVPGTIKDGAHAIRFEITDGKKTVNVVHHGNEPVLFKNGAPVLCEGRWASSNADVHFDSDRILIKHGSEYKPPKVDTKKVPAPSKSNQS